MFTAGCGVDSSTIEEVDLYLIEYTTDAEPDWVVKIFIFIAYFFYYHHVCIVKIKSVVSTEKQPTLYSVHTSASVKQLLHHDGVPVRRRTTQSHPAPLQHTSKHTLDTYHPQRAVSVTHCHSAQKGLNATPRQHPVWTGG